MQIQTVVSTEKQNRVAAHSHITGLGINERGEASVEAACGLVGQKNAREVRYCCETAKEMKTTKITTSIRQCSPTGCRHRSGSHQAEEDGRKSTFTGRSPWFR